MKEEVFVFDFAKLEKEFLESNRRLNPYLLKIINCLKLKQVESDLAANRRWNRSSQALN